MCLGYNYVFFFGVHNSICMKGKGNIILKFITKIVQTCSLGVMNIFHGLTQEEEVAVKK